MYRELATKANTLFDRLVDAMAVLAAVMIVLMMVGTSIDVFLRFFFNSPVEGLMAFCEFGLLFVAFLSAPWLLRLDQHVRLDFLVNRLTETQQRVLAIVTHLLGAFMCLVLIRYGTQEAWELWEKKVYDIFKLAGFPKAIPVAIIPAGGTVLLIQFLKLAYQDLKKVRM